MQWYYFPQNRKPSPLALEVVRAFDRSHSRIRSYDLEMTSNEVLQVVAPSLRQLGFLVESGKQRGQKVIVPVLYGMNGEVVKSYDADAHHVKAGLVVEVEAGRAVANNQYLKDLFQACLMDGIHELCIAVRLRYRKNSDFEDVVRFMQTLYASTRVRLPLEGVLVIGY